MVAASPPRPGAITPTLRVGQTPEPASGLVEEGRLLPRTPEPRIFSTPCPTPDPDRFTPEYVLERVTPGFVREPNTVARLRLRFSAFYGEKEAPPPKPIELAKMEAEEAREQAAKERVPVRRERVGVCNIQGIEGAGKNNLSRWVERVDPGHLPPSGRGSVFVPVAPGSPRSSKPGGARPPARREQRRRAEEAAGPLNENAPLSHCEYRGLDLPWGVSGQPTGQGAKKNQSPLTVGLVLRRFGAERFLPGSWKPGGGGLSKNGTHGSGSTNTARMRRSQFKEFTDMKQQTTTPSRFEPGYRLPRKPSTRADNKDMRAAGFRTTDRYIF